MRRRDRIARKVKAAVQAVSLRPRLRLTAALAGVRLRRPTEAQLAALATRGVWLTRQGESVPVDKYGDIAVSTFDWRHHYHAGPWVGDCESFDAWGTLGKLQIVSDGTDWYLLSDWQAAFDAAGIEPLGPTRAEYDAVREAS